MMHAGLLLLLWMAGVAGLQFIPTSALLAVVFFCGVGAALFAGRRCLRLVRRVRFLLLAIVVLFAGFTPGEAVLVDWPALSPSREGVLFATEHAARLLGVVFSVSILMERLPPERLLAGLLALFRPLALIGLPVERAVVRVLLVLRFAESGAPGGWRGLLEDEAVADEAPIRLRRERFGAADLTIVAILFAALFILVGSR